MIKSRFAISLLGTLSFLALLLIRPDLFVIYAAYFTRAS